jgi:hypothetical protein
MLNTSKLIILTSILALMVSCSSKKEPSNEPSGISYKSSEVLVRQCSDISNHEQNTLFEDHEVTIKKQISPHLYIVTWDDDRNADAVIHELKQTQKFCGLDRYQEQ